MNILDLYRQGHAVCTDSRAVKPGCLFFALKGATFDGNQFVPQALAQGASLCVTSSPQHQGNDRCLVVKDVLATLQQLATDYRHSLSIPILGVTGTNGKTTTKELLYAVLSRRYRTHATAGNFNNHIGVPLTLLSIPSDAEMAIVEMGANHPGEIAALCHIADPDCGLITNVGRAHLEGFGSFEGVVQTKTELYRHLAARHGLAFVNADNDRLLHEASLLATANGDNPSPLSILAYGSGTNTLGQRLRARGTLVGSDPYMRFYFEEGDNVYNVRTHLLGGYNFDNCMAAVAVGLHFGVDPFDIKEAIEQYVPSNNRSQFKETGRNRLYLDCYNANPSSMKAALDSFSTLTMPRKIVMLGGMKELGSDSRQEHETVLKQALAGGYERVVLVGPEFQFATEGENSSKSIAQETVGKQQSLLWFPDAEVARQHFATYPLTDCTVLLKGSNSTRMWLLEEVL